MSKEGGGLTGETATVETDAPSLDAFERSRIRQQTDTTMMMTPP
eukprot:CAMPEP_0180581510 /NCGR_PEP_ID=MMETSP1037_2-20121125/14087_1 /TAXON_ID=632150 /ORGANISM="Azadinium spinosum, Strain 3D9" /LENGTH=43 /DNA_ID= /DNA_START= /DNA_END= /DNA_ORIENTATION=